MAHLIYKILTQDQWRAFGAAGFFTGAPIDLADGYIHFSTATQAAETAAKHFTGQTGLMLAAVDGDALGQALKYEISRGDQLFPHLYDTLRLEDVVWCKAMPLGDDHLHVLPIEDES